MPRPDPALTASTAKAFGGHDPNAGAGRAVVKAGDALGIVSPECEMQRGVEEGLDIVPPYFS